MHSTQNKRTALLMCRRRCFIETAFGYLINNMYSVHCTIVSLCAHLMIKSLVVNTNLWIGAFVEQTIAPVY